jgi:hypothetical protein
VRHSLYTIYVYGAVTHPRLSSHLFLKVTDLEKGRVCYHIVEKTQKDPAGSLGFCMHRSVKGDTDRYASREKLTDRWEDVYDRQICRERGFPTKNGQITEKYD